ncbi:MAG: DUF4352 domain-containing protein [Clostridia bacterium]|nr:DUF4352 domain-containing protein [Clostridia bacterium]MBO5841636.1 DUF4352 domain-containing protein [Clostridia bacterium]
MKKFLCIVFALMCVALFVGCDFEYDYEPSETKAETESTRETTKSTENTTEAVDDGKYAVGEVVETRGLKITYVSCEEYTPGEYDFFAPKDGYRFVICTFEFENTGSSDAWLSYVEFDCYADSFNCENCSWYFDNPLSATLSSGRKAVGIVAFEVPIDAKVVDVEYDIYDFFDTKRIVFVVK